MGIYICFAVNWQLFNLQLVGVLNDCHGDKGEAGFLPMNLRQSWGGVKMRGTPVTKERTRVQRRSARDLPPPLNPTPRYIDTTIHDEGREGKYCQGKTSLALCSALWMHHYGRSKVLLKPTTVA